MKHESIYTERNCFSTNGLITTILYRYTMPEKRDRGKNITKYYNYNFV